jgi:hypothetical protein
MSIETREQIIQAKNARAAMSDTSEAALETAMEADLKAAVNPKPVRLWDVAYDYKRATAATYRSRKETLACADQECIAEEALKAFIHKHAIKVPVAVTVGDACVLVDSDEGELLISVVPHVYGV